MWRGGADCDAVVARRRKLWRNCRAQIVTQLQRGGVDCATILAQRHRLWRSCGAAAQIVAQLSRGSADCDPVVALRRKLWAQLWRGGADCDATVVRRRRLWRNCGAAAQIVTQLWRGGAVSAISYRAVEAGSGGRGAKRRNWPSKKPKIKLFKNSPPTRSKAISARTAIMLILAINFKKKHYYFYDFNGGAGVSAELGTNVASVFQRSRCCSLYFLRTRSNIELHVECEADPLSCM